MSLPGDTKYIAVPNGWTKVTELYADTTGKAFADWVITCRSNTIQYAYADTTPTIASGHPLSDGDYLIENHAAVSKMWMKNNVSATVGNIAITPRYEF